MQSDYYYNVIASSFMKNKLFSVKQWNDIVNDLELLI